MSAETEKMITKTFIDATKAQLEKYLAAATAEGLVAANDEEDPFAIPEPAKVSRFAIIEAGDFGTRISEPDMLIENVLPAHGIGMIFGPSGSHKTTALLDMMTAHHRGIAWHGNPTKKGRGVIVVAEGAYHFPLHLQALAKHLGCALSDLPAIVPAAVNLAKADEVREFAGELAKLGAAHVCFDTKQQNSQGSDEDSVKEQGVLVANMKWLHEKIGGLVTCTHHTGHSNTDRARGSSIWKPSVDVEICASFANGEGVLEITKQKEGPVGALFPFKQTIVELGISKKTGKPYGSVVIEQIEGAAAQAKGKRLPQAGTKQRAAYDIAAAMLAAGECDENDVVAAIAEKKREPEPGEPDRRKQRAREEVDKLVAQQQLYRSGKLLRLTEANVKEGEWK